MKLDAIRTVYSYYLPEVRELITELGTDYPHDVFLRSVSPGLDDFHEPIVEKLIAFHANAVPALGDFAHRYPTSGSEEGIREYLSRLAASGVSSIYMWEGDYEGYREDARSRGIEAIDVPFDADPATLDPGHWMLSNPSARDGNLVDPARIEAVLDAGHRVFYDLAYLGMTDEHAFDVSHPNVDAVVLSFSKPYGLFCYRIGFTFAREPITPLVANKWFKNVFGLLVAERLLDSVDQRALAGRYKAIQAGIVERTRAETGLPLRPSDAFLLAHVAPEDVPELDGGQRETLADFARGDGYRLCLTPAFEQHERGEVNGARRA